MRRILKKIATVFMTSVMLLSMAGCATYKAPTSEQFSAALEELGYRQVEDAAKVSDINSVLMSFTAFGGGGYLCMKFDDPYDTSRTGYIRGATEEVLCLTDKGTRYLLIVFDNNENAKFYYDTMKNQIEDVTERDGSLPKQASMPSAILLPALDLRCSVTRYTCTADSTTRTTP